jgi:hypothetical protein
MITNIFEFYYVLDMVLDVSHLLFHLILLRILRTNIISILQMKKLRTRQVK